MKVFEIIPLEKCLYEGKTTIYYFDELLSPGRRVNEKILIITGTRKEVEVIISLNVRSGFYCPL